MRGVRNAKIVKGDVNEKRNGSGMHKCALAHLLTCNQMIAYLWTGGEK